MNESDNTKTYRVNMNAFQTRNGHNKKAIQALKDSGYKYDGTTKTWTGDAASDYQGMLAHYVQRGTLVEVTE